MCVKRRGGSSRRRWHFPAGYKRGVGNGTVIRTNVDGTFSLAVGSRVVFIPFSLHTRVC